MLIAIIIIIMIILVIIGNAKLNSRVVECVNCHNKMTIKRWRQNHGCIKCGSDLYQRIK
jgi:uncharacterized CHY-type Zn-finger protein